LGLGRAGVRRGGGGRWGVCGGGGGGWGGEKVLVFVALWWLVGRIKVPVTVKNGVTTLMQLKMARLEFQPELSLQP